MTKVLLLQMRVPGDMMATHELQCFSRKLGPRAIVQSRNALAEAAEPAWLDGFDAVLFGGSGDFSVHHTRSRTWVDPLRRLLERALELGMPGFGVCFGHQLLGLHLGSQVITDPELTEIGTVSLELTPRGEASSLFRMLASPFKAQTGHSDHVLEVPAGVELLATGERVKCQAFGVRGTHFYTTQFHPDLTGAEARYRYLAYQSALQDVTQQPDAAPVDRYVEGEDEASVLLEQFVDITCRKAA